MKESKTVRVEHTPGKPLTSKQNRELAHVASLPDNQIDTSVAWLKKPGRGYQTRANRILREQMLAKNRKRA